MTEKLVSVGTLVNYVLDGGTKNEGEVRPAFVVKVHSPDVVNLVVFVDGQNDYEKIYFGNGEAGINSLWRTSVLFSEDAKPRTWHWIDP